jgi:hypothetical protein
MSTSDLTSRRGLLAAAGAGIAGAAVLGAVGDAPAFAGTSSLDTDLLVLTVANAAKGEFTILVGERAIPITDLEFASKIAKAIA